MQKYEQVLSLIMDIVFESGDPKELLCLISTIIELASNLTGVTFQEVIEDVLKLDELVRADVDMMKLRQGLKFQ